MTILKTWLYLISTVENAAKLLKQLDDGGLTSPPLDPLFGPEPRRCPLDFLYGPTVSQRAYSNDDLRPALDAWDCGLITTHDLRRLCNEILNGRYTVEKAFNPASFQHGPKRFNRVILQNPWEKPNTYPSSRKRPYSSS